MKSHAGAVDVSFAAVTSKRSLLVISHAMELAFEDAAIGDEVSSTTDSAAAGIDVVDEGLVIGFFQRRVYFDIEAARYAALAAQGHTVIVAFTGTVDAVPDGVTAVSLSGQDSRAGDWVVSLVRGAFAATLSARDIHQLTALEETLEAARLFHSWSTLRRHLALAGTRDCLDHLAPHLPADVLARARHHIATSAAQPVSQVEDRLAAAADHLLWSMDAGYERATTLRLELEATKSLAERDQLTGLNNRHYLERYLGDGDRPADLLAMLVDVDGLKQVNDTYGHEAGDALLRCVAETLSANTRPGDVLIRWGGDEFLVLVPLLDLQTGLRYGERLAAAIGSRRVDAPWEHLVPSASVGVSPARHAPLPMAQLDAALHHIKQHNRGHAALPPT